MKPFVVSNKRILLKVVAYAIMLANIIGSIAYQYGKMADKSYLVKGGLVLLLFCGAFIWDYSEDKKHASRISGETLLLLCAIYWIGLSVYSVAAFNLLLLIVFVFLRKKYIQE